jgi:hypothetical protein
LTLSGLFIYGLAFPSEITLKDAQGSPWLDRERLGDRVIPRYENGFLMSYAPTAGDITLFDRTGTRLRTARVRVPEASFERIVGTAVSPKGRLVASILAYSNDGKMVDGLAWIDSSGNVDKFVRTTPFAVRHLSFAPDETLWALGDVYDTTLTNQAVKAYDVLWKFDSQGKLVQTSLNSSTFQTPDQVASRSQLAVSGNIVGVLFELGNEWVEVSSSGDILGRWSVPCPPDSSVVRVAMTSSGDVLIQRQEPPSTPGSNLSTERTYLFNKRSGVLSPVDVSATGAEMPLLMGTDGDRLVWRAMRGGDAWIVLSGLQR